MSLTRADAEAVLLEAAGPAMALAGLAVAPGGDGTIAAMNSAIRAGLFAAGVRPAARAVGDADLALVAEADEEHVLAVARLALLDLVLDRWALPNVRQNQSAQNWGDLYRDLVKRADRLRLLIAAEYGIGAPTIGVGALSLGILEPADEGGEYSG